MFGRDEKIVQPQTSAQHHYRKRNHEKVFYLGKSHIVGIEPVSSHMHNIIFGETEQKKIVGDY